MIHARDIERLSNGIADLSDPELMKVLEGVCQDCLTGWLMVNVPAQDSPAFMGGLLLGVFLARELATANANGNGNL